MIKKNPRISQKKKSFILKKNICCGDPQYTIQSFSYKHILYVEHILPKPSALPSPLVWRDLWLESICSDERAGTFAHTGSFSRSSLSWYAVKTQHVWEAWIQLAVTNLIFWNGWKGRSINTTLPFLTRWVLTGLRTGCQSHWEEDRVKGKDASVVIP